MHTKIHEIRGQKVMLDYDLAELYGVETAQLKRAVRRNIKRFEGDDFMFEQTKDEFLRCQIGISKDTRAQLDAINIALADLQASQKKPTGRKRIGFNTEN